MALPPTGFVILCKSLTLSEPQLLVWKLKIIRVPVHRACVRMKCGNAYRIYERRPCVNQGLRYWELNLADKQGLWDAPLGVVVTAVSLSS